MSSVVEAGPGQQPSENPEFVRYRETAAQFNARKQAAVHDRRLQPLPVHHELLRHRWLLGYGGEKKEKLSLRARWRGERAVAGTASRKIKPHRSALFLRAVGSSGTRG
ncbi:MAG: hypothetical protein BJ554DRAFT_8265 [Olpidium bornovanus]|uniref:Uncharacterized protein n=1 Tax=Olpidium bornovanus TaxID=278681 RepID=A0A8H7ZUQ8_9FUNG|nr:MAG: hypothetical protein BJ554DRAFT_8265 [Olpidium bornovanus]